MPSPEATAALLAAVAPIAAYVNRTPPGNAHADKCAVVVDRVADYVEEVEAENATPPGPDWEHVTSRILAHWEMDTPQTPLMQRTRQHLDRLQARAALPLAERMARATTTSHHLGTPTSF